MTTKKYWVAIAILVTVVVLGIVGIIFYMSATTTEHPLQPSESDEIISGEN